MEKQEIVEIIRNEFVSQQESLIAAVCDSLANQRIEEEQERVRVAWKDELIELCRKLDVSPNTFTSEEKKYIRYAISLLSENYEKWSNFSKQPKTKQRAR